MPHDHVLVTVQAGRTEQEELAVRTLGNGRYRLEVPSAMTLGLAVGDVFKIDDETRRPSVEERSGNVTVWLYPAEATEAAQRLTTAAEDLGGRLDGAALADRVFIFTLPVNATFPAIERLFNQFVDDHPGSEWLFANVYDDDGVTPLSWWTHPAQGA
jgi:hypothetical protein